MTEEEIQQAIKADADARRAWKEVNKTVRLEDSRNLHPNIEGLPDYGIDNLTPDTEEYCRSLCERFNVDYEYVKAKYAVTTQVIPHRKTSKLSMELLSKGVVSINDLNLSFKAYVQGNVQMHHELEKEHAERVRHELLK